MDILDFFIKAFVLISGYFDAEKYETQRNKIIRLKTAKSQSRMFLNKAFVLDIGKLVYVLYKYSNDWILILISVAPLLTIARVYWVTYLYYPYKLRGLQNFKRPGFWTYFCNSWISNSKRKRL
jgi:hypothetical protein